MRMFVAVAVEMIRLCETPFSILKQLNHRAVNVSNLFPVYPCYAHLAAVI